MNIKLQLDEIDEEQPRFGSKDKPNKAQKSPKKKDQKHESKSSTKARRISQEDGSKPKNGNIHIQNNTLHSGSNQDDSKSAETSKSQNDQG